MPGFAFLRRHLLPYALAMGSNGVLRLVAVAMLWRAMDSSQAFRFSLLEVWFAATLVIGDCGLAAAIIRFGGKAGPRAFRIWSVASPVVAAILSAFLLNHGPRASGEPEWPAALALVAAALSFSAFNLQLAAWRAELHAHSFAAWSAGRNVLWLCTLPLLLAVSPPLVAWYGSQVVANLSMSLLLAYRRPPASVDASPPRASELFAFGLLSSAIGLVLWVEALIDASFLAHFSPESLPGYRIQIEFASLLGVWGVLLQRAWPALFFRSMESNHGSRLAGLLTGHLRWMLPAVALWTTLGQIAIPWLAPDATPSLAVLLPLVLGNAAGILLLLPRTGLEWKRRQAMMIATALVWTALDATATWLLVPRWGAPAAAWASACTTGGIAATWILLARRERAL